MRDALESSENRSPFANPTFVGLAIVWLCVTVALGLLAPVISSAAFGSIPQYIGLHELAKMVVVSIVMAFALLMFAERGVALATRLGERVLLLGALARAKAQS